MKYKINFMQTLVYRIIRYTSNFCMSTNGIPGVTCPIYRDTTTTPSCIYNVITASLYLVRKQPWCNQSIASLQHERLTLAGQVSHYVFGATLYGVSCQDTMYISNTTVSHRTSRVLTTVAESLAVLWTVDWQTSSNYTNSALLKDYISWAARCFNRRSFT